MTYLDTSALAKKYIKESGSEKVKDILGKEAIIATSKLTYAEMLSALIRRTRSGDISKSEAERFISDFENDWSEFYSVGVKDDIFSIIKRVIGLYSLRGVDSIHLASAVWLKEMLKEDIAFVASDANLLEAAQREGLHIINPEGE